MKFTRFEKISLGALVAIIALIAVGALVRVTGSGLGCPDWPRCYGSWVPPTDASQLPPQFDRSEFNVARTWTEYLNRWAGVIVGILVLAMFVSSLKYRRTNRKMVLLSALSLFLVAFNGWLGGVVVKTELLPHIITYHMMLAFLLMALVLYILYASIAARVNIPGPPAGHRKKLLLMTLFLIATSLFQVVSGTEVREVTDIFLKAATGMPRAEWLDHAGLRYPVHRTAAWLVLVSGAWIFYMMLKEKFPAVYKISSALILAFILLQVFTGIVLQNMALPPAAQVLHLLNSALLFCAELVFLFMLGRQAVKRQEINSAAPVELSA